MKRIVLILLLMTLGISSLKAQNLAYRNDDILVFSAGTDYLRESGSIGVAVEYEKEKATRNEKATIRLWVLSDNLKFGINQGAKALIRTFSGTVIELIQKVDWPRQDSKYLGHLRGKAQNRYYVYPDYPISMQDLLTLVNEGVQKVRLETSIGMKDYYYDTDVIGSTLKKEMDLILNKIDLDSDF